jgi:hypothetical protein
MPESPPLLDWTTPAQKTHLSCPATSDNIFANWVDTAHNNALNVWSADLSTPGCPDGAVIEFTFFWKETQRSESRNYSVKISGPK